MSLEIDPREVSGVLLTDGWHTVKAGTFTLDSYEVIIRYWNYEEKTDPYHLGGQSGICAKGFEFQTEEGDRIGGPFSSVLALRYQLLSREEKMEKYPADWDGHPQFPNTKKSSTSKTRKVRQ